MSSHKILFQIPASTADSSIWLYERKETLDFMPGIGHSFIGKWVPSVFPPGSGVRNIARKVTTDLDTGEHLVQFQGFRDGSRTAEELDKEMIGWKRHPTPLQGADLPLSEG